MASGTTIVASDLPFVHEVLNKSEAMFVLPDNVEVWVKTIRKALADVTESSRYGKAALKRVDFFDIHQTSKQILQNIFNLDS